MTTIAALARDGHVVMAADSACNVYERPVNTVRKIRRLKAGDGEALIGVAGTSGLMAVAGNLLTLGTPPEGDEAPQPWVEAIAIRVTQLAVEQSLLDDGTMDGTLLFGWRGRLWTISHATAIPHEDGIAALGSGEGMAIGAMDALLDAGLELPPPEIVVRAVTLAIARDKHSDLPIWVEHLPASAA